MLNKELKIAVLVTFLFFGLIGTSFSYNPTTGTEAFDNSPEVTENKTSGRYIYVADGSEVGSFIYTPTEQVEKAASAREFVYIQHGSEGGDWYSVGSPEAVAYRTELRCNIC